MSEILLSFVVPIYNVEEYLNECLDSIFDEAANKDEFEVIAVDDGSTDSSPEILKTYAHHKNFRIITQVNGGSSAARNTGIKAALGKYIAFVDSDDFLLPGVTPVLLSWARESDSDIIEFDYETTNETSLRLKTSWKALDRNPMSGSGKEVLPAWSRRGMFTTMVWLRIYKRRLLTSNPLSFYPGIVHEDDEWIYRCFFFADSVVFHPLVIYNYRRRDDSITLLGGPNIYKRCNDFFTIMDSLVDFVSRIPNNPENADFLYTMDRVIADLYRRSIGLLSADWDIAEKEKLVGECAKRIHLIKVTDGSKRRYLYWFLRLLPLRMALRLYNIIEKY